MAAYNMKKTLAQFPLQIVVFPGEEFNLHIFEPRYRELINDCEAEGITFGIPTFLEDQIQPIGCEVRLKSIEKRYEGGEMDVCTVGVGIFRIIDFYSQLDGKLYAGAVVDALDYDLSEDPIFNALILERVQELFQLMQVDKKLPASPLDFTTYQVAHYVGFSVWQEYEFLNLLAAPARQQYLFDHLEHVLPIVREMNLMRERALLNGHFRHFNPPQL